ncbi:BN860_12156g1_1 [Zygosaccharomyces bailii CLIB 213]|uniref:5-hydroxyisourate hydrolase n=1 Tax=Zygosaccharomyces bailii (strain CLIB 213 / ATCC 58445 / CBS 680 / BCRC 21525 / NBRC 1098 / NCYC 1416 / NRRL Y-2227) TaxID=1333698 RepID=A0A8J2T5C3_ZYGB2|nr:BN860_12156g1_1 [Zygosaccharomyces bailii CLIB 213]
MANNPVTCHILDTTSGKPAANVVCCIYKIDLIDSTLAEGDKILMEPSQSQPFAMARTNDDGRVPEWIFEPAPAKRDYLKTVGILERDGKLQWDTLVQGTYKIRFQVGKYFASLGQKNFHPFVDIMFTVEDPRHYHIPLLLSNYGYTTYRGS